jgi:DNA-binding SARP family transcriptional activator
MSKLVQTRLSLALLGGFQARVSGEAPLLFPTRKAQALVTYLALKPGGHAREKLATLLWGDTTEDRARNSLRQTVFALRRLFVPPAPACLRSEGETLSLDRDSLAIDVLEFEQLAAGSSADSLARAAAMYTGDLLEGINIRETTFDDWLTAERERFRELALDTLAKLLSLQAKAGAIEAAIQTSVRLLAMDALQEPVHRTLMRLYVQQGRRNAALKQFQICTDVLRKELGVDVEAATKRLHEQILEARRADLGPIEALPSRRERAARTIAGASVLVVDDDIGTRLLLEKFLSDAGCKVVVAQDGSDALLHLAKRPFDVVVSDIQMPMLDGLKLLEIMGEKGIEIPAIFLTGQSGNDMEVKGLTLGAADYIRKPVEKEVLLLRVKNVLTRA